MSSRPRGIAAVALAIVLTARAIPVASSDHPIDSLIQAERTRTKTARRKAPRAKTQRRTTTSQGGTKRRREPAAALRGKEPTT